MAEVVNLRGEKLTPPDQPVVSVCELAEDLAQMALSGEARGVLIVGTSRDGTQFWLRAGEHSLALLGAVERLKFTLLSEMEEQDP